MAHQLTIPTRTDPCPTYGCTGRIRVPVPVPHDREVVATCTGGLFARTWAYRLLHTEGVEPWPAAG